MASTKNSDRRKRKYGDAQKNRTARHKANAQRQHDHRMARMIDRTQKLIGQQVKYRSSDGPGIGTVTEVVRKGDEGYPTDAKRRYGAYVKIRTPDGSKTVSRHRVKLIRKADV